MDELWKFVMANTGHGKLCCLYKCTAWGIGPLCAFDIGNKQITFVSDKYTLFTNKIIVHAQI